MNESSLLDRVLPIIHRHLEMLWLAVDQQRAFYARGSATLPSPCLTHEPWDMDFLLFVVGEVTLATRAAAVMMVQIRKDFPDLPHPDIRVVQTDLSCPQNMHALLLLSESGHLLFGEDLRQPSTFFQQHRHAIFRYAQEGSTARLIAFENCKDKEEKLKRAPHLAKSMLRLGGLLRLRNQSFSRNPEECASWLQTISANSSDAATLLVRSLTKGVEPSSVANACRQILADVNQVFLDDIQRD
jgi:hypothetical protein